MKLVPLTLAAVTALATPAPATVFYTDLEKSNSGQYCSGLVRDEYPGRPKKDREIAYRVCYEAFLAGEDLAKPRDRQ